MRTLIVEHWNRNTANSILLERVTSVLKSIPCARVQKTDQKKRKNSHNYRYLISINQTRELEQHFAAFCIILNFMLQVIVKKLKSIAEILSSSKQDEEIYVSEKYRRKKRAQKGYYSRDEHLFDFIHLVNKWESIVGKMLADNTIPLKIRRSTLYILTKHSIFSSELSLMSQLIIAKIEKEFPYFSGKIKKISFSSGNYSSEEFNLIKEETHLTKEKVKPKPHPFDPKYRARVKEVEKMFSDVEDETIRKLLINITLE